MKIHRLLGIILFLMTKRTATARELADYFEVSIRTIYRDMDTLAESGIPLLSDQGLGGGYGLPIDFSLDRQILRENDLETVSSVLKGLDRTLPDPDRHRTLERVNKLIPNSGDARDIVIDMMPWGSGRNLTIALNRFHGAIRANKVMRIRYIDVNGEESERTVEPMSLVFRGTAWYLWGWCRLRDDFRLFKFNRIIDGIPTDETFDPRPGAYSSLGEGTWGTEPVRITLEIEGSAAARVREEFPDSIIRDSHGNFIVEMSTPIDPWLTGYLLGWGSSLRVIEPREVREKVEAELGRALKKYGGSGEQT